MGGAAGAEPTDTVTLALAPPQLTLYVVVCVGRTVVEPEVPFAVKPEPVHEAALVEDQARVDDWPDVIDAGEAVRVAVGDKFGEEVACVPELVATPTPVRAMVCVDPVVGSRNDKVPARMPASVGVNVTEMVQLWSEERSLPHVLV